MIENIPGRRFHPFDSLRSRRAAAIDHPSWIRWFRSLTAYVEHLNPALRALVDWSCPRDHPRLPRFITTYKDLIDLAGTPTRCGSQSFERMPVASARIVRILEDAGFWTLGKNATTEFGIGTNFDCENPLFPRFGTSGSSSGSAAAVAAGFCDISVATDTIGSTRLPASSCGVVGLKLTYDPALVEGLVPISTSLDTIGFITRTVDDLSYVWRDGGLGSRLGRQVHQPGKRYCIGIADNFRTSCASEIRDAFDGLLLKLARSGFRLRTIGVPWWHLRVEAWRIAARELHDYHLKLVQSEAVAYLPDTLRAIHSGSVVNEHAYIAAREKQAEARKSAGTLFADHGLDALILPVAGNLPREKRLPLPSSVMIDLESSEDPTFVSLASIAGLPAISVPIGLASIGCPISIQLLTAPGTEDMLITIASSIEQIARNWTEDIPIAHFLRRNLDAFE